MGEMRPLAYGFLGWTVLNLLVPRMTSRAERLARLVSMEARERDEGEVQSFDGT